MPSTDKLSCQIMLAFLSGLKDTDGKSTICLLISQIIQLLGRRKVVKMTGSASHATSYSTLYGVVSWMNETASSLMKSYQVQPALSTTTSKPDVSPDGSPSSSSSSSLPTESGECNEAKISTADLLVYAQPLLDWEIQTKLVVSLKVIN